jgi:Ser/Thr protein kinase RdoA (MazF antagonist)
MKNMRKVTEHIHRRLEGANEVSGRRWETARVLHAKDCRDHWIDPLGSFWRAMSFIENSLTYDAVLNARHAREIGYALGMFHNLLSDLIPRKLFDTLEGFHITPTYLKHYDDVLAKSRRRRLPETSYCQRFVEARRLCVNVLEDAKGRGLLKPRPIHGDPKINNVLIDADTGKAIAMIDLDTVKPGLIHYDIGDCLRSSCNSLGEETDEWERAQFDPDLCKSVLEGYLQPARCFFTEHDYAYIYEAIRLLSLELGIRFFTDYLEGDVYFKVKRSNHNLLRALVQFKLTESIESQKKAIHSIVNDLKNMKGL